MNSKICFKIASKVILCWIGALSVACNESQDMNEGRMKVSSHSEIFIDLDFLVKQRNLQKSETVNVVYDHYFKTAKKYQAFSLRRLVDSIISINTFDTTDAVIVFKSKDGYNPVIDLSKVFKAQRGYIAFRDLSQTFDKDWADSISSRFTPFYLVWDDVKASDKSFVWPYGLIGISLISAKVQFKDVYPFDNDSMVAGFKLFEQNCMKCHTVNKVGGDMGPELNVPKNITEYWKEEDIYSFVKEPQAFRVNSKMPAITNLSDTDIYKIVSYLKYMKGKKISL